MAGTAPATAVELAAIESAPLADVVGEMLANSDNNTAEMLVKELGFDDSGAGTREAGLAVIERTLAEWAVDTAPMVFADGSGLSPDNRATCTALLSVLQRSDPDGPIGAGLPIAGQTGTLSDIFVDHPIAGRLLGKTGTLSNPPFNQDPPGVKALAGLCRRRGWSGDRVRAGAQRSDDLRSERIPPGVDLVWPMCSPTYPEGPTPANSASMNGSMRGALMRVEVVAAPIRYPAHAAAAAVPVALVPVVGLTALLLWSDTKADEYESVEGGCGGDTPPEASSRVRRRRCWPPAC